VIKIGSALMDATEQLERERGIPKHVVLDSLCDAMMAAYRKYSKLHDTTGIYAKINEQTGEIGIYSEKIVVEQVTNEQTEISIEAATAIDENSKIGTIITEEVTPEENDQADTVTMDVPLLIRMMELAREEIKDDATLHHVAKKMIDLGAEGKTLDMEHYEEIIAELGLGDHEDHDEEERPGEMG